MPVTSSDIRGGGHGACRIAGLLCCASLLLLSAACTSGSTAGKPAQLAADVSAGDALAGSPFAADVAAEPIDIDATEILALNDDLRSFIGEYVSPRDSRYLKLQQLLRAVISDGSFGLVYEDNTRTASGTFEARSGNCLSFTNMFIAMARDVGLDVNYQEVDIPPDWSMRGDAYVLSRHVNVRVNLGASGEHVVDFNIDDFKTTYDRREISDERAYAHFYSNMGVEQMQDGNHAAAFQLFQAALEFDREFAPGWSNLGALYSRAGQPAYAEVAYLEALRLQSNELLVMSNLARLYQAQGNQELADYYRERVQYHRDRNPYYRYELARQAFLDRDYATSIENLEYAVRKKQWEDSFYFLMGLNYLQLGDEQQARRWLEKAESVAEGDALKRNYQSKIDLLLSSAPPE